MTLSRELTGRRAALVALGTAIAVIVLFVVGSLALLYSSQNSDAADNRRQLAQYEAEIAARPRIEAAYEALKTGIGVMPALVHAEAGAPAAAQVETAVKELVEASGGELRSAQALASTEANGFEIVQVECDLTVPASRLRELLYAVETHRPYLFINSADITAPIVWDIKNNTEPAYEVRWSVSAYRWIASK